MLGYLCLPTSVRCKCALRDCTTRFLTPFSADNAAEAYRSARQDGYYFVTTALATDQPRSDVHELDSYGWSHCVVGDTEGFDLEWAHHMKLPAVRLPLITEAAKYASKLIVAAMSATSMSFNVWVPLQLASQSIQDWQFVYRLAGANQHIGAALVMAAPPPTEDASQYLAHQLQLLHLALTLPIKCLVVPTNLFLTNKRGYPTLSKAHQTIVEELLRRIGRTVRVLVEGPSFHASVINSGATGCLPYLQYLQHLRSRESVTAKIDTDEAKIEASYLDTLQRPLQPLKDHLEFGTYETFEKDPVKYVRYQEAIALAMRDCQQLPSIHVFVVGAGRGPLVDCALGAYQSLSQRPAKILVVAVEKNPSAVVYLRSKVHFDEKWRAAGVQILQQDLRNLSLADTNNNHCDIVVSELLGSFADNELSPECLDAFFASNVCRPDTISIPQRYVARVAPISSAELHSQARNQALYPNDLDTDVIGSIVALETPYVVRSHAASQLHDEQDCWVFEHPSETHDRQRYASVEFTPQPASGCGVGCGYGVKDNNTAAAVASYPVAPQAWTMTGLLGTFSADLYVSKTGERSVISTAPSNFSTGMFSWFPLYFPLQEPLHIPASASVQVYIWRKVKDSRVWYEWSAAVHRNGEMLSAAPIHNPCGRSYHVSM